MTVAHSGIVALQTVCIQESACSAVVGPPLYSATLFCLCVCVYLDSWYSVLCVGIIVYINYPARACAKRG